ncbi:MAG TPA: DNA polymerase [Hyphomicrobiaceae bacterium]|nr:DNA polymerase [Hyphomicrobiaceae bacterium]
MHAPAPTIDPERIPGRTFAADAIGWIDFETKSETDLRTAGAYRYAIEADAVILAHAVGDEPVKVTAVKAFGKALQWRSLPKPVRDHHERVLDGAGIWAAWNAGFDRAVWNYSTDTFPFMQPHHIIDVMCQATAAGLPPDLFKASHMVGGQYVKQKDGRDLLRKFLLPGAAHTPQSNPEGWQRLISYAHDDVAAMRHVFKSAVQLALADWKEYWAMEAINARGIGIDLAMVAAAAELAKQDGKAATRQVQALLGDSDASVNTVNRLVNWLLARLPPEGVDILTKREEEIDEETGEQIKPAKYALRRNQVQRLLAYVANNPDVDRSIKTLLQLRLYGGSKTPAKYSKMLHQHVDGVLYGQYVFNGAGQTGRASSRGVQIHNLARDTLPYEHDAIEALLARDFIAFDALDDTPIARKLALLIRPSFVPAPGNVFVWSDWSQIEARVLPWLAGDDDGAEKRLQIFRDVDADPSVPDLYTRTAAELSHVPVNEVTKPMRQRGKVAELALGFRGGVGALQNMAAGYGLHLDDVEAKQIVDRWRAVNKWNETFSVRLWEAMRAACDDPGKPKLVGRINMIWQPAILGGSLLMVLPSKRVLTYRRMKWDNIDVLDDDDQPTGEKRLELMCHRGYGRIKLWPGMFVENATQACAADILRGTLRRLDDKNFNVRLHTHDEILCEVFEREAEDTRDQLRVIMQRDFSWSAGLPIMSEETIAPYYTKQEL